jgi:hypothetical protein
VHDATLEQPSSKSNTLFWNNLHQNQIRYSGTTFIKIKYVILEQPSSKSNTLFWNNLHQSQIPYSGTTFIKVNYVILEQPSSKSNTLFFQNSVFDFDEGCSRIAYLTLMKVVPE